MQFQRASDGQAVRLTAGAVIGVGGEARIYAVPAAPDQAAKLYHRPTREHATKLAAMLANRPEDPMTAQGHVSIAWPTDLLRSADGSERVLGFFMPRVMAMNPIFDFYHPKTRRAKHPFFNYRYLLRTAHNLATCVSAIHARGYVIGDLNESNILVGETALVTLVDTDSFQVPDALQGRIHRCRVGKPEFTPPELQNVRFEWVDRKPEHDLFGLGVLFFQLLLEGIHPFAGRHRGSGEPPSLEQRITAGAFPYALSAALGTLPMPSAPPFELLAPQIRELFLQCFVQGQATPSARPEAQTWQRALLAAEQALVSCTVNAHHLYGNHLSACPWCERRELLQGMDSFPSEADFKRARFRRLDSRPHKPLWRGPVDYESAIREATAAIGRRRRERRLTVVGLCVVCAGLLLYWCWVLRVVFFEH